MSDQNYSGLIPAPHQFSTFDEMELDQWMRETLSAIGEKLSKARDELRNGKTVSYAYKATSSIDRGIILWERHYKNIAEIVRGRGYTVEVDITALKSTGGIVVNSSKEVVMKIILAELPGDKSPDK